MLKPHEIETYRRLEAILREYGECCLIADTGIGKSRISSHFVEAYKLNALIISHRKSINSEWESWNSPYISTTTTQNFYKHYEDFTTGFDIYIFDECQYIGAPKWGKAYNAFKLLISENAYVLGLTATPHRYERNIIENIAEIAFGGHIVYGIEKEEAIRLGVIHRSSYVYAIYNAGELVDKYSEKCMTDELRGSLDTFRNMPQIKDILIKHAPKDTPKKGIVYMHDIDSIEEGEVIIRETFPDEPIWSIHSNMPKNDTNKYREEFKKSESGFLVNVDMASEGLHYPGVNMIIMLSKTGSPNKFKQRVGRGSNTPGCVVFDLVGSFVSVQKTLNRIGKDIVGFTKLSSGFGFEEFVSDQEIVYDYVTDLLTVLQEIDDYNSSTWTSKEDDIIYQYYPDEGSGVCQRLHNRTPQSCINRANKLGIKFNNNNWTDLEDSIIKEKYLELGMNISELLPGRSRASCCARARYLNIRKNNPWSEEEDEILKSNYPEMGPDVCNLLPGRTPQSCINRANSFGIISRNYWTDEEDEILKANYPEMGKDVVKLLPGRNLRACYARAKTLNISFNRQKKSWSEEEDEIFKANYPEMGQDVYKLLPGRTKVACRNRAKNLNIYKNDNNWTQEEDDILRKYYPIDGANVYKRIHGRTGRACQYRANLLGLRGTLKEWTQEEDDIIRNHYPDEGRGVCQRLPGRTKNACQTRANKLGVNYKPKRER